MKIKLFGNNIYFTRYGITINDLLWVYPWKRYANNNKAWYSTLYEASLPTFKSYIELDDGYIRDMWKIHRFPHWNDYENYPDGE